MHTARSVSYGKLYFWLSLNTFLEFFREHVDCAGFNLARVYCIELVLCGIPAVFFTRAFVAQKAIPCCCAATSERKNITKCLIYR